MQQAVLFWLGAAFLVIGLLILVVQESRDMLSSGLLGGLNEFAKTIEGILARVLPGEAKTHGAFLILVGLVLIGLSFYVSDAGDVNAHRT